MPLSNDLTKLSDTIINNANLKYNNLNDNPILVDNKDRISKPILTKFEYPKIYSIRKRMLIQNFNPLIDTTETNIDNIIKEEIRQKKIPIKIKRPHPNNKYEIWKLSELQIPEILFLNN